MPYAGKKSVLLYIAMIMSAVSGIMVLMPMVFIHRIVNTLILNETVDFSYVRENSIYAAAFAGLGLCIYLIGLVLSHIFAFEVEDTIIKTSVKNLIHKPKDKKCHCLRSFRNPLFFSASASGYGDDDYIADSSACVFLYV